MSYCVPDFEMDEDYSIPFHSVSTRSKKSPLAEEDIMELLWQNGQVVMQSKNQRSVKRSQIVGAVIPAERREIPSPEEESTTDHLFMQEDEMASWLHYPMYSFDRGDLYSDLIYPTPCAPVASPPRTAPIQDVLISPPSTASAPLPPIHPPRRPDVEFSQRIQNYVHFSTTKARVEPGPSSSNKVVGELTVVDSCETPAAEAPESMGSHVAGSTAQVSGVNVGRRAAGEGEGRETGTYELTSSQGGSGDSVSASVEPFNMLPLTTEDRKRKGREADEIECPSEDMEFDSPDAEKRTQGSPSAKKSRVAEVHNLSERRRRDRINEKMRALQELIPRCNKSDKASMLDEAIEYLKALQLQVQMMSMGRSMVPMMFPGFQQYMPPMGMAMGMGMGMGMEMGMSRPLLPFPSVLAGSAMPTSAAAAHMGPRFPVPAFHMPSVPLPGPTNQSAPILNSLSTPNPNQPQMMNFPGPYQQYIGLHRAQVPLPQNQAMMQPSTSKPSSSREVENHENLRAG